MTGKPLFQTRSIWHGAAHAHGTSWEPWRRSSAVYWGYVTLLDELIGRLLGRLDSLGLAENTIVIVTGDHGEQMGSHGIFQKCCMYEESLRVPLLVRLQAGPRRPPDRCPGVEHGSRPDGDAAVRRGGAGFQAAGAAGRRPSGWLTGAIPVPPEDRGTSADPTAGAVFASTRRRASSSR